MQADASPARLRARDKAANAWVGVAVVAMLALVMSACGGDDDPDNAGSTTAADGEPAAEVDAAPFVDAVAESLASVEQGYGLTPEEARCMAVAVVGQLDLGELEDSGVTPRELRHAADLTSFEDAVHPDASDVLPSAFAECNLADQLIGTFATAFGTSAETVLCMRQSIDNAELGQLYASIILTGAEGEALGAEYGEQVIGRLPGDCARTIVIGLLRSDQLRANA